MLLLDQRSSCRWMDLSIHVSHVAHGSFDRFSQFDRFLMCRFDQCFMCQFDQFLISRGPCPSGNSDLYDRFNHSNDFDQST